MDQAVGTQLFDSMIVPHRVSNLDEARRRYGTRADYYVRFMTIGDPLADAALESFQRLRPGEGQRLLDEALEKGIEHVDNATDELRALFAQLDAIPAWVDWKRLRRGAFAYQRTGLAGGIVLSALSLMNGYHSAAAVKPLVYTGQLDKMARRRLAETGRFIADTVAKDGLERFAPGFKSTVKVRMVHAAVRRMLAKSPSWDTEAWGTPINNADMAATSLSFSVAMLYGTKLMGLKFTQQEADDLMLLWRYSGYLSGVDPGLLSASEAEGMEWAELIDLLQSGPDEGSVALAQALRRVIMERAESPFEKLLAPLALKFHDGVTRATAGDDVADDLGVPHRHWKYAVPLAKALVWPAESLRPWIPFANRMAAWLGNQAFLYAVERDLEGKRATFRMPKLPDAIRERGRATSVPSPRTSASMR